MAAGAVNVAEAVVKVFDAYRRECGEKDQYLTGGRQQLVEAIGHLVKQRKKIRFLLPGFPMKSQNRDKTIGVLPDLAEEVALKGIHNFCEEIASLYAPGCEVIIFCDGRVYCDVFGNSDDWVLSEWRQTLHNMVDSPHIVWKGLDDFFSEDPRGQLLQAYKDLTDVQAVKKKIETDHVTQGVYGDFQRFATEETTNRWTPLVGGFNLQDDIALRAMIRHTVYNKFLSDHFPDEIRLSIHRTANSSGKYSFSFLKRPEASLPNPWHACAVRRGPDSVELMTSSEARTMGYTLKQEHGRDYYFE